MAKVEVPQIWRDLATYAIEKGRIFWSVQDFVVHLEQRTHLGDADDSRVEGGNISIDEDYLEATIRINFPSIEDDEEFYRIITHEMAHLALIGYRPMEKFVEAIQHSQEDPALGAHIILLRRTAMESTVCRLERAFRQHYPLERALKEIGEESDEEVEER